MIICHCRNITCKDIDAAIDWMRAADPQALITPGKIYRALGKSADCGGCMPLFLDSMRKNPNLEVVPSIKIPAKEADTCKAIPKSSTI